MCSSSEGEGMDGATYRASLYRDGFWYDESSGGDILSLISFAFSISGRKSRLYRAELLTTWFLHHRHSNRTLYTHLPRVTHRQNANKTTPQTTVLPPTSHPSQLDNIHSSTPCRDTYFSFPGPGSAYVVYGEIGPPKCS